MRASECAALAGLALAGCTATTPIQMPVPSPTNGPLITTPGAHMSTEKEFVVRAELYFEYRVKAENADAAAQLMADGGAGRGECVGYSVDAVVSADKAAPDWADDEDERTKCVCGHLVYGEHNGLWSGEPGQHPKPHPHACDKHRCDCLTPVPAPAPGIVEVVFEDPPLLAPVQQSLTAASVIDAWNAAHPVGTPVQYWPGVREGDGWLSRTRTAAEVLGGHTPVVWVEGASSCIALTHIEPVQVAEGGGQDG